MKRFITEEAFVSINLTHIILQRLMESNQIQPSISILYFVENFVESAILQFLRTTATLCNPQLIQKIEFFK